MYEDLQALNEDDEEKIDLNADAMPEPLKNMDLAALKTCVARLQQDRKVELEVIKDRYQKKISYYSNALTLYNKLHKPRPVRRPNPSPNRF